MRRCMAGGAQLKKRAPPAPFQIVAEWTGLEPATPGVTGRYSNQLNYRSTAGKLSRKLVGGDGIEPPTLCL